MFALSWFYLYGAGTLIYGGATLLSVRMGVLDFSDPRERRAYWTTTAWVAVFAAAHALFQFVLPFVDPTP